jgi:hypothetical protein
VPRANAPFQEYRLEAARNFAQTMVVVDDMASQAGPNDTITVLRPPKRIGAISSPEPTEIAEVQELPSEAHALDAKTLIDNAMDLGLVCSVLRPREGENIRNRVKRVARCADIVCLDWEIYGDRGASATTLIKDIVLDDVKRNGRLRLIAIYTGDTTNIKILDKISEAFTEKFRNQHGLKQESLHISSKTGLKIVCLFKAHGVQLPEPRGRNQVSEEALPARLQTEFASLAEGLLSNVALAIIASIRDSTHHVLGNITGQMDGPYFHHRAVLPNAGDAEEYAVEVVLSDLKNAIDKHRVAQVFAGPNAIAARIREMVGDQTTFSLKYEDKSGPKTFDLATDDVVRLIKEGYGLVQGSLGAAKPSRKIFEESITTLFTVNRDAGRNEMNRFAVLTGVRSYPVGNRVNDVSAVPALGLGSIVQDANGKFLLCLQASCDSVRLRTRASFLFIPLDVVASSPDHVVPVARRGSMDFVGFAISSKSYSKAMSIEFEPSSPSQTVIARKLARKHGFYFVDFSGALFKWIANLKSKRALRTAQRLGQDMGRLGFDEFEPYRKSD